jgi:hypothetical protein
MFVGARIGLVLGLLTLTPRLHAQTAAPTLSKESIAAAQEKLQSGSEPVIREGLETLASATGPGSDTAANAVIARLHRGLPPQLIEQAIDALVLLHRPSAGPALLELTQHRRTQVRAKAMAALAALQIRSAQSALLYALDDPSPEVRGAAVAALGHVGDGRAVAALLTAAERGVPGAWQASAQLARAGDVKEWLARAAKAEVADLRPALDALLTRSNLPADAKLRTVEWVRERGSVSARGALLDWLAALPKSARPDMRHALLKAVEDLDREHPEYHQVASAPGASQ